MGAEDFSYFANAVPAFYFDIGGMPTGKDPGTVAPAHTADFFIDESGFKTGVTTFCNLVLDYMNMQEK